MKTKKQSPYRRLEKQLRWTQRNLSESAVEVATLVTALDELWSYLERLGGGKHDWTWDDVAKLERIKKLIRRPLIPPKTLQRSPGRAFSIWIAPTP